MTTDTTDAAPAVDLARPRMRQDVAFLETLDGVYVRGRDGAFVLRGAGAYRYLSALLPHLNGSTTLDELVSGLPAEHGRTVRSLLSTLASRGVLADGPDPGMMYDDDVRARYASQLALLDHHGDDGSGLARAMSARVAVVCEDAGLADALIDALTANGVGTSSDGRVRSVRALPDAQSAVSDGVDVVCLIATARPRSDLFAVADAARAAGTALVPLLRIGDQLVLGPHCGGHGDADLYSALLRMSDNGVAGTEAIWQAASAGAGAPAPWPAIPDRTAAMAVSIAGFEIFKILTGAIPTELTGSVMMLDPATITTRHEAVLPHPSVTSPDVARTTSPRLETDDAPADDVEQAYTRFETAVAETAGVMRRFDDDALPQIPVKVARLVAPAADPSPIIAFGSATVLEARLAALEKAAARYALNLNRRVGLLARPGDEATPVPARRLETWLGIDTTDAPSVAARDLADGRPLAVDGAAVLAGPWDRGVTRFEPALAGLAAAPDTSLAASRALLDAAGALAVAEIADGATAILPVPADLVASDLKPGSGRLLATLTAELAANHRRVDLYAGDGVVPVAVVHVSDGLADRVVAFAGRSWADAAESALLELAGADQLAAAGEPAGGIDEARPPLGNPTLAAPATALPAEVDDEQILRRLAGRGRRAALVDLTPPDLAGITTVARALLFRDEPDPTE